ncbi:rhomboid family intramembrane serine protease [bacterium]|nr:rhomboid family intramembrane serine protease [bacterium]
MVFLCPNCRSSLKKGKNPKGIAWVCPSCQGKALTISLLRKKLDKTIVNELWRLANDEKDRLGKQCPSCEKAMQQVSVTPNHSVLVLDICRRCQMAWFDCGEMEILPEKPHIDTPTDPIESLPLETREAIAKVELALQKEKNQSTRTHPDEGWKTLAAICGMPVEFDGNPLKHYPWLTWVLALIITGVAILTFQDLSRYVMAYGLIPAELTRYNGLTFVTAFFIHGGIIHLLGNLYFLLIFGDNVEDYLGTLQFALLLIMATFVGDLFHLAVNPSDTIPTIGASGGISGIIVFYALQFPKVRLGFIFYYLLLFRWVKINASTAIVFWVLLQLWGAYNQIHGLSHVSAMAHIGGALTGFLFWLVNTYAVSFEFAAQKPSTS